jgi:molybdopterin molybdotransferase
VVVQELVETTEGTGVRVPPGIEQGANVREAGEDLRPGDRLLPAGTRLNAAAIASLASVGMSELDVFRRPRVAFFSTGDELRGLGQPLEPGQIYDSNRYALHALLSRCGVSILDLGVVADDPVAVRAAFEQGAREADVLITTGGVSVGSADYVTETLRSLGEVGFWKIAMKPGRPLAFGRLGECLFFGLPGNPVSTVVTFLIFVRGALLRMGGEHEPSLPRLSAIASQPLRKRAGRVDYQRGRYAIDPQGLLRVESAGGQGSHLLGALARSNCLIVLPREATEVEAGAAVEIIPLQGLL